MSKGDGKAHVKSEVFVETYCKLVQDGKGVQQVADALNLSASAVYTRVKSLRKAGVALPEPVGGQRGRVKGQSSRPKGEVETLKAIVAKLTSTAAVSE